MCKDEVPKEHCIGGKHMNGTYAKYVRDHLYDTQKEEFEAIAQQEREEIKVKGTQLINSGKAIKKSIKVLGSCVSMHLAVVLTLALC